MTALSVWWRRNFGHRNDPPAMLPDPVRWTYELPRATEATIAAVIEHQTDEGWTHIPEERRDYDGSTWLTFHREDGAYRWRDDGYRGY